MTKARMYLPFEHFSRSVLTSSSGFIAAKGIYVHLELPDTIHDFGKTKLFFNWNEFFVQKIFAAGQTPQYNFNYS